MRKSDLAKNRDIYVRFFRAMAKSTVFAYTNPDVAIKLHYEVYPESKPKGKTDAEALVEARKINNSRREKWYPGEWQSDKRFGAMSKAEWEAQVKFAGLEGQIKDVSRVFTTDLSTTSTSSIARRSRRWRARCRSERVLDAAGQGERRPELWRRLAHSAAAGNSVLPARPLDVPSCVRAHPEVPSFPRDPRVPYCH